MTQTIREIRAESAAINRRFNLVPDSKLETLEELNNRLESIKSQLEKLCDKPYSHNIRKMELLDAKIRKLGTRKANLEKRRSIILNIMAS